MLIFALFFVSTTNVCLVLLVVVPMIEVFCGFFSMGTVLCCVLLEDVGVFSDFFCVCVCYVWKGFDRRQWNDVGGRCCFPPNRSDRLHFSDKCIFKTISLPLFRTEMDELISPFPFLNFPPFLLSPPPFTINFNNAVFSLD